jgi:hypothetical protein
MAVTVRAMEYFYVRIEKEPRKAYQLLSQMASEDINVAAFSAVPYGPNHTELTLFPEDTAAFQRLIARLGIAADGPQHAIVVQGDDRLGELATIHGKLSAAGVAVYASTGVTDGEGGFGYVIYTKESDHKAAEKALAGLT